MIPILFLLAGPIPPPYSSPPSLFETISGFFQYNYASLLENPVGFIVLVLAVFLICILTFKIFKGKISLGSVFITFFAILGLIVLVAGISGVKHIMNACIPSTVGGGFASTDCGGQRNYWPALNSVIAGAVFIIIAFVIKFFKKKI